MDQLAIRDDLVATLEETLRLQQRLATDAGDDNVPVAELVAQVSVLERLDDRRDELISQLRRTARPGVRAGRLGQPVREVVLEVLAELRWPQNAGFLEEYLLARRGLQLDSRAFASLRRDERRAWDRAPGARKAYIVPALNPDGSANPRWITTNAWKLERRIVVSEQTERLFDLQKILSLAGRPGTIDGLVRGPHDPLDSLLARYAQQILEIEPLPVDASADDISVRRTQVRDHASALISEIRRYDDPRRKEIASQLADLPPHAQLWGSGLVRGQTVRGRRPAR